MIQIISVPIYVGACRCRNYQAAISAVDSCAASVSSKGGHQAVSLTTVSLERVAAYLLQNN
jgi:hypothetical protein